jgi:hypothetical protein
VTTITRLALAVAAATSFSAAVTAQNSATQDDGKREFTIAGCLLRSGYAGYQIDEARVEAIDGKTVEAGSRESAAPKKWILDGGGNLGPRTGEKVQVVGRSDWQPASHEQSAADEPPNKSPHLDVKTVKTLASSCS